MSFLSHYLFVWELPWCRCTQRFCRLIAGIIGGIVVAALSGSRLGVSGPAAGLAVIVATAIGEIGYSAFLWAVVLAGVLQLASGFCEWGYRLFLP